jgi:2-dehydropantoate 2-reductase
LIVLGELDNRLTDRLAWLQALIAETGIEARATDRIRDNLWVKIIANLTSNPLSVLADATLEQIYGDASLKAVSDAMMHEVMTVAAAYGARVLFDPLTFAEQGAAMGAVRTSMLQDYQNRRPLELAAIGDAVLELAQRFDIAMPITRSVLAIAHFRDAQRAPLSA